MTKLLLGIAALVLAATSLKVYGCSERAAGAQEAKDKADRKHAEELVKTNTVWLEAWAKRRPQIIRDTLEVTKVIARANAEAASRQAEPELPNTASSSDTVAQLQLKVASLEREVMDLRIAFANQQRITMDLLAAADTGGTLVQETTVDLDLALEREDRAGKFNLAGLGIWIPKPPKWLAGTIGCAGGGLAAGLIPAKPRDQTRNRITGCASGAAAATIALPTD